jgi:hypothetical protein
VIPNRLRIRPPRIAKARRMMRAYREDSFAIRILAAGSMCAVRETKTKVAARGFTMMIREEKPNNVKVRRSPAIYVPI